MVPAGNLNITMEYQGDHNTVAGFQWYLVTISGQFKVDSTGRTVEDKVYCRLFTDGRLTSAGVTHAADVEPETVLTNISITCNRVPITLTNGASVRIANVDNGGGIRFESTVDTELYKRMTAIDGVTVELGTIIVPYDSVEEGKEINFENFTADKNAVTAEKKLCVDIKQTKWQDEANGIYTAALINIKSGNYNRSFASRGYMRVTYENGDVEYYYSNFEASANVRSIAVVAAKAIESGKYNDDADALAILRAYAGQQ